MFSESVSGRPIPQEKRMVKTSLALVQNIDRSIRTDWGGRDALEAVTAELKKIGLEVTEEQAKGVLYIVKGQVEAIRKRTSHDREELRRRFESSADEFAP